MINATSKILFSKVKIQKHQNILLFGFTFDK